MSAENAATTAVPASTWNAPLSHLPAPETLPGSPIAPRYRRLYRYAIPLYRHATSAGY